MKDKDLFNAIDNIDEEFITEAGKYLQDDESIISFHDTDPIEVRPAARKFSPIRLIAPIAAAVLLVGGITFALKTLDPFQYTPEGTGNSEETSSYTGNVVGFSSRTEKPEQSSPEPAPDTKLPFTLYGPDYQQLTYGEVGEGIIITNTGYQQRFPAYELTDNNWSRLAAPDFAYIAVPKGANYNSADDPEMLGRWRAIIRRSASR